MAKSSKSVKPETKVEEVRDQSPNQHPENAEKKDARVENNLIPPQSPNQHPENDKKEIEEGDPARPQQSPNQHPENDIKQDVDAVENEPKAPKSSESKGVAVDETLSKETEARVNQIKEVNGSMEDKILGFLKSRGNGSPIKINDFLKSLYGVPKPNEPIIWQQQTTMKQLKLILTHLVNEGKITISSARYQELGRPYFPDDKTGKTHYHGLDSIVIEAKAV